MQRPLELVGHGVELPPVLEQEIRRRGKGEIVDYRVDVSVTLARQ